MRIILSVACALGATAPASAQEPDWNGAARVAVTLRNFKYEPPTITLEHGRPYLLHFDNKASGGHDFAARSFFAAATVARSDQGAVKDGTVELDGGESLDIRLIAPAPGRYAVRCTHFMHSTFGMKGEIVVH